MKDYRRLRQLQRETLRSTVPPAARFIGGVFGFVFFGIGVSVLIFLWAAPFGEFGSPPLIFRVFGSFIAVAFVAVGGTTCVSAIFGLRASRSGHDPPADFSLEDEKSPPVTRGGYRCPQCGAPLSDGVDISPHGDAKCTYCNCWFNIHGK